jgi:hypothetical protein
MESGKHYSLRSGSKENCQRNWTMGARYARTAAQSSMTTKAVVENTAHTTAHKRPIMRTTNKGSKRLTREEKQKGWLQMGKAKILGMNKPYVPNNRDRKRNPFPKKKVKK